MPFSQLARERSIALCQYVKDHEAELWEKFPHTIGARGFGVGVPKGQLDTAPIGIAVMVSDATKLQEVQAALAAHHNSISINIDGQDVDVPLYLNDLSTLRGHRENDSVGRGA